MLLIARLTLFFSLLAMFVAAAAPCPDPLNSVLSILDCIEMEDPVCTSLGYASSFIKFHNGIDTNTTIDNSGQYWSFAFALVDFSFDYGLTTNIGPNQAALQYNETVTFTTGAELGLSPPCTVYPWGHTVVQHEYAVVTVNDECQMRVWAQYGDDAEQATVDDAVEVTLSDSATQCAFGVLPPSQCTNVTITCVDPRVDPGDDDKDDSSAHTTTSSVLLAALTTAYVFRAACYL